VVAIVVIIVMTVHPSQSVSNLLARLSGFEVASGKLEFSGEPARRDLPKPILVSDHENKANKAERFDEISHEIGAIFRAYWEEDFAAKMFEEKDFNKSVPNRNNDEIKVRLAEARFYVFYKFMIPLVRCAALGPQMGYEDLARFDMVALKASFQKLMQKKLSKGEELDILDVFLNVYKKLVKSSLLKAHLLAQDPRLSDLVRERCQSMAFIALYPTNSTAPFDPKEASQAFRELVRSPFPFNERAAELAQDLVASNRSLLIKGIEADLTNDKSPWGAMMRANLARLGGSDQYAASSLVSWTRNNGAHENIYGHLHILEQSYKILKKNPNTNAIIYLKIQEKLIDLYYKIFFNKSEKDMFRTLEEEAYCDYNFIARQYFKFYMISLNNFAATIAGNELFYQAQFNIGPRDFKYIDIAKQYVEILKMIDLDCLYRERPNAVVTQRMAFIDTEIALSIAELTISDVSSDVMRRYWHGRLSELRGRAQDKFFQFQRLVARETRERSADDLPFWEKRQSTNYAPLALVTERMDNLGRYINSLQ